MSGRTNIPASRQAQLLTKSRRICALCFGLKQDSSAKIQGQIAHIDRDNSNNAFENLAWLCLECHDRYDTTGTSQSKSLQKRELRAYQDMVFDYNEEASEFSEPVSSGTNALKRNHDREKFRDFEGWLDEQTYMNITYQLGFEFIDQKYSKILFLSDAIELRPSFRFLDSELQDAFEAFLKVTDELGHFIAGNFYSPHPQQPDRERQKLLPNRWTDESHQDYNKRYNRHAVELLTLRQWFEATYTRFRRLVQERLFV